MPKGKANDEKEKSRKIKLALIGKKFSMQRRNNIRNSLLGRKLTTLHKLHISRGDNVKYQAFHIAMRTKYGKADHCKNRKKRFLLFNCSGKSVIYDWAKKDDRKYSRKKKDYYQLCRSCHIKYDRNWIKK